MGAPTYSVLIAALWTLIVKNPAHYVQTIPVSFQGDNSSLSSFNASDDKNDEVLQEKHVMTLNKENSYLQAIWNNLSSTASWNSGVPGLQAQQNLLSDISRYQDTLDTSTDLWSQYYGMNDPWNITAFNEVWNDTSLNDVIQEVSADNERRQRVHSRSSWVLIVIAIKVVAGLIILYRRIRMKRRQRQDQEMLQQETAKNSAPE